MEPDKGRPANGGEGCLVGVVRIPVKIVAVLVVLPVRVVWDLLVAFGRTLNRHLFGPIGRGLGWCHRTVVRPVARALGLVLVTLLKLVFVWPWVGLWRYVLVPVGQGLARLGSALSTHVLAPIGGALLRYLLRPAGQGISRLARAAYAHLLTPSATDSPASSRSWARPCSSGPGWGCGGTSWRPSDGAWPGRRGGSARVSVGWRRRCSSGPGWLCGGTSSPRSRSARTGTCSPRSGARCTRTSSPPRTPAARSLVPGRPDQPRPRPRPAPAVARTRRPARPLGPPARRHSRRTPAPGGVADLPHRGAGGAGRCAPGAVRYSSRGTGEVTGAYSG